LLKIIYVSTKKKEKKKSELNGILSHRIISNIYFKILNATFFMYKVFAIFQFNLNRETHTHIYILKLQILKSCILFQTQTHPLLFKVVGIA
jgi:hypothetical protein